MHFLVVSDESLTVNPLIQCDECDHLANSAESLNCHKEEQIFSILKSFFLDFSLWREKSFINWLEGLLICFNWWIFQVRGMRNEDIHIKDKIMKLFEYLDDAQWSRVPL